MVVDSNSLYEFLRELGDVLNSNCTLVAAGGTALTLHDIKHSTEDVDFVVVDGREEAIKEAICSINGPPTDLFPAGMVFNNPLPPGYVSRAKDVGAFGVLTVMAMDPLDVIMTKIARAEGKDMEDIRACAAHGYTADDILGAAGDYCIDTPELRNNMRDVLREVYGVDLGSREDDMR